MKLFEIVSSLFLCYIIACIFAIYKTYKLRQQGYTYYTYIEVIKPKKMLSFVVGSILDFLIPQHIFEQYVLRFYDQECRKNCLIGNNNKCVGCGCKTSAKMFSPWEHCTDDNWVPIIFNKKQYEQYRKENPVSIKIQYHE